MATPDQPTCGKGLAENSVLPAALSNVISALASNLDAHTKALDLTDANARAEFAAYEKLIDQLRQCAVTLQMTANEMAGYRDLPMGRHDETAMRQPAIREAFERFVQHKRELSLLLQKTTERDNQLLTMIRSNIP